MLRLVLPSAQLKKATIQYRTGQLVIVVVRQESGIIRAAAETSLMVYRLGNDLVFHRLGLPCEMPRTPVRCPLSRPEGGTRSLKLWPKRGNRTTTYAPTETPNSFYASETPQPPANTTPPRPNIEDPLQKLLSRTQLPVLSPGTS
jgi:hypothetical protein